MPTHSNTSTVACHEYKKEDCTPLMPWLKFYSVNRFIYKQKAGISHASVYQLIYTAEKYMLTELSAECCSWIMRNISGATVIEYWNLASLYGLVSLQTDVKKYMFLNAPDVLACREFTTIPLQLLEDFLDSTDVVADEAAIYRACLRWGETRCMESSKAVNGPTIREVLGPCVHLIRFPLMDCVTFEKLMGACPRVLTQNEMASVRMGHPRGRAQDDADFSTKSPYSQKMTIALFPFRFQKSDPASVFSRSARRAPCKRKRK